MLTLQTSQVQPQTGEQHQQPQSDLAEKLQIHKSTNNSYVYLIRSSGDIDEVAIGAYNILMFCCFATYFESK